MAAPSCSLAQCNPHPSIPCWPLFIYSLILWWWWRLSIIDYIIIIVLSPRYCGHSAEKTPSMASQKERKSCLFLKDGRRWERIKSMATPPILGLFHFCVYTFHPFGEREGYSSITTTKAASFLFSLCHRSMYVTLSPERTHPVRAGGARITPHTHIENREGGFGSETIVYARY